MNLRFRIVFDGPELASRIALRLRRDQRYRVDECANCVETCGPLTRRTGPENHRAAYVRWRRGPLAPISSRRLSIPRMATVVLHTLAMLSHAANHLASFEWSESRESHPPVAVLLRPRYSLNRKASM